MALTILVRDDGRGLIGWRARVYNVANGHLVVERDAEGEPRWAELEREAKRPWNRLMCWIADLWEK